jgi:hypothetical protein
MPWRELTAGWVDTFVDTQLPLRGLPACKRTFKVSRGWMVLWLAALASPPASTSLRGLDSTSGLLACREEQHMLTLSPAEQSLRQGSSAGLLGCKPMQWVTLPGLGSSWTEARASFAS